MKAISPVIPGLDRFEIKLAENQEQYQTLPVLRSVDGRTVSRWTLSDDERQAIAAGADLYLTICSATHPPVNLAVAMPDQIEVGECRMDMRLDDELELRTLAIEAHQAKVAMEARYKAILDGDEEVTRLAKIAQAASQALQKKQTEIDNPQQPQGRIALVQ